MKYVAQTIVAMLVASAASAAPMRCDIVLGDASGGTSTVTDATGFLEEILVLCTDGASTGTVSVSIDPTDTTVAEYNIATNVVIDEKRWVPRRDATDIAGAALTSDPPQKYYLAGDAIRLIVTSSATNKAWRLRVKMSD